MKNFNRSQFECVEEAIILADRGKSYEAALLCKEKEIPIEVAHRVILTPNKRRSYPIQRRQSDRIR